jgi:hypothetical protein
MYQVSYRYSSALAVLEYAGWRERKEEEEEEEEEEKPSHQEQIFLPLIIYPELGRAGHEPVWEYVLGRVKGLER